MEITLTQMLTAREERAFRQFSLNRQWGKPMVSFSMNIPGPVKDSPLIRRGFFEGVKALDNRLPKDKIRHREVIEAVTGWEAIYVLDMPAGEIKAATAAIEDERPLGRLFDMDVLDEQLNKLDREPFGGKSRDCIVCGAKGRGCASRRIHSVPELQAAVYRILSAHFAGQIGEYAVQALLDEVRTTPKPGLVDCRNCGSHRDMDLSTFHASANALEPYFEAAARLGMDMAQASAGDTFPALRKAGLEAEQAMYAATNGVNTHKGAIFTIGILCACAGRLWAKDYGWDENALFSEAAAMTVRAMEADLAAATGATAGERLYASAGIRGIRGEAAAGFPSVQRVGLPAYRAALARGESPNDAGLYALLHLIAGTEDTCLLHRGGVAGAQAAVERVKCHLDSNSPVENLEALDDWFMERNLSPGGSADLLAATYFVKSL